MMAGHGGRIGSLQLQGLEPVLASPLAGVSGAHNYHRDVAQARHCRESGAEVRGGHTGYGSAQPLSGLTAAKCFSSNRPRVGEIEVLDHNRATISVLG
jgi:hypothetical protein